VRVPSLKTPLKQTPDVRTLTSPSMIGPSQRSHSSYVGRPPDGGVKDRAIIAEVGAGFAHVLVCRLATTRPAGSGIIRRPQW